MATEYAQDMMSNSHIKPQHLSVVKSTLLALNTLKLRMSLGLIMTALGVGICGHGVYLGAKAQLAQALLQKAWTQTVKTGTPHKPWSWLDAYPIAKLTMPRHNQSAIVLNTDSGQALAFGPALISGTARPDQAGLIAIAAHKNTHFKTLQYLRPGDKLVLQTQSGHTKYFIVSHSDIIDTRRAGLPLPPTENSLDFTARQTLVLVTCYPFDSISFNGPLRYIIYAKSVTPS